MIRFLLLVNSAALALALVSPPLSAATRVEVARVEPAKHIDELPISGTVTSPRSSDISATVAGAVTDVFVDSGTHVRAGDPVIGLDSRLANLDLQHGLGEGAAASARLAEAERQARETQRLFDQNTVGASVNEAALAAVAIAKAEAERADAAVRRLRELVDRHTIRAPFDGVIAERRVETGEWVATGSPLLRVVELGRLRVDLQVPQFYFPKLKAGLAVTLSFDALPDESVEAVIDTIVPVSSESARTFLARIELDNDERRITPGMSVRARIALADESPGRAVQVPRDAVVRTSRGHQHVVRIRGGNGDDETVAEHVSISVSGAAGAMLTVESSELDVDDLVIVRGNEIVRDGETVEIANNDSARLRGG